MSVSRRAVALALGAAVLGAPALAQAAPKADVTVMSRNLYLGADLIPLVAATDRADFEQRAAGVWQIVQQTNFPVRAKALAKELATNKPDLVGLQEAALWRKGAAGVKDGATTPATEVVYDFTKTLIAEAKRAGVTYKVAVIQDEFDFEAPIADGYDIRLTQQDAILIRKGSKVKLGKSYSGRYTDNFVVQTQVGEANSRRGWVAVDATLRGKKFRFVDTHLEAYGGDIRLSQANELLGPTGPMTSKSRKTILVGDLNSDPRDADPDNLAYDAVTGAGFKDVFSNLVPTSGQNELVNNPVSELARHIDLVLTRPKLKVVSKKIVGDKASDRIQGLWPSDHAGVVAKIRIG